MFKIKDNEIGSILNFVEYANPSSTFTFFTDYIDNTSDFTDFFASDDYKDFISDQRNISSIITKCAAQKSGITQWGDEEFEGIVELTPEEVKTLNFFIDINLLEFIREDRNIDNLYWLKTILNVYDRLEKEMKKNRK